MDRVIVVGFGSRAYRIDAVEKINAIVVTNGLLGTSSAKVGSKHRAMALGSGVATVEAVT